MYLCNVQQNPQWCNKHNVHINFASLHSLLQAKQPQDLEWSTHETRLPNETQLRHSESSFSQWWRWKVFSTSTGSSRKSKPVAMLLRTEKLTASPRCCLRLVSFPSKFLQMTGWRSRTLALGYQVAYLNLQYPPSFYVLTPRMQDYISLSILITFLLP